MYHYGKKDSFDIRVVNYKKFFIVIFQKPLITRDPDYRTSLLAAWAVPFMQCYQQMSPVPYMGNQKVTRISDLINSKVGSPYPSMGSHFGVGGTSFFKAAMHTEKRDLLVYLSITKEHAGAKKEAVDNIDGFLQDEPRRWSIRQHQLDRVWGYQKNVISFNKDIFEANLKLGNKINTGRV